MAPIDYNAVLADLEAKRGQMDAAIAVIRALIAGGTGADAAPPANGTPADNDGALPAPPAVVQGRPGKTIQTDIFFQLSTSDAIRKYLGMVTRPQAAHAIADALRAGGQVHAADEKTAYTNVANALRRSDDFIQTRTKEWGLAKWYGNKSKGDAE